MNIAIRYDNGRVDVFDTMSFTAPQPLPGINMLTNYELRLDRLGEGGLWLETHYYAVAQAWREEAEPGETPAARRKRGWRFLLAEKSELDEIQSVEMDGVPVLRRAAGTLFDCVRFDELASAILGSQPAALYPRIMALYGCFERMHAAQNLPMDAASIAAEFGFTAQMIADVEAAMLAGDDDGEVEEEVWDEAD